MPRKVLSWHLSINRAQVIHLPGLGGTQNIIIIEKRLANRVHIGIQGKGCFRFAAGLSAPYTSGSLPAQLLNQLIGRAAPDRGG